MDLLILIYFFLSLNLQQKNYIYIYIYIYIYTATRIDIGYMLFSVITLVYVRHFAWYLVSNIS